MHNDDCQNSNWSIELIEDHHIQHHNSSSMKVENNDSKSQYKQHNSHNSYEYLYNNENKNISLCIQSWKNYFRDVWEMKCALPSQILSPRTPRTTPRRHYSECIEEYSCNINPNI